MKKVYWPWLPQNQRSTRKPCHKGTSKAIYNTITDDL